MSGNRDSANAAETGTEGFVISKENDATNKGVTAASPPLADSLMVPSCCGLRAPSQHFQLPLHIPASSDMGKDKCHLCHPREMGGGGKEPAAIPTGIQENEREERAQAK